MTPVTQIFLYLSYGILAIAVALLPPRLIGLDSSTSSLIAMFVFFLAWQLHQHYLKRQDEEIRDERLERLEDFARFMRQDLKKTRTELEHVTEIHNGKNQKLMSELAVLQTLVSQAVEKGSELGVTRRNAEAQERRFSGKPAADTHSTVSNDTAPPQGAPSPAPLMASLEDEEMLLSIINQHCQRTVLTCICNRLSVYHPAKQSTMSAFREFAMKMAPCWSQQTIYKQRKTWG